jgi:hypothetical protein
MEQSKTLICSSEFLWTRKRISSKFIENLGTRPKKDSAEHNIKLQKLNKSFTRFTVLYDTTKENNTQKFEGASVLRYT